ncbi:MAG TPA: DUF2007 domain-containing protein [Geobacteraceae bacterium]|nr:DUF2007 domain-containing protein [Geobacteraceae bacterium]
MARFYDAVNSSELARIENILKNGGVEYSLGPGAVDGGVREILVAEEDVAYAERLLATAIEPVARKETRLTKH